MHRNRPRHQTVKGSAPAHHHCRALPHPCMRHVVKSTHWTFAPWPPRHLNRREQLPVHSTVLQSIDLAFLQPAHRYTYNRSKEPRTKRQKDPNGFLPERSDEYAYRSAPRLTTVGNRSRRRRKQRPNKPSSISDHLQRVRPAQYPDRRTNRAPENSENALSRPRAIGVAVMPPGSKLLDHARERVDSIAPVESEVAHRQQRSRRCVLLFSTTTSEPWRHRANL